MCIEIGNDVNKTVAKMSVALQVLLKQREVFLPWFSVIYDSKLTSKIQ